MQVGTDIREHYAMLRSKPLLLVALSLFAGCWPIAGGPEPGVYDFSNFNQFTFRLTGVVDTGLLRSASITHRDDGG